MQFLYPGFLWALLTALIPVIIHLFTFRRYKTVYFSNVAFLQNIQKESKSKSKLKNLLLLLLRVLAIVFLVLVFAKPVINKNNQVLISNKDVVAVYIDNSFSMEGNGKYGKMLEYSKMKALEIASSHDLDALFLLTTNEFELKHHKFVNKDQFIDWVSQIKPTHLSRNFQQVYERQNLLFKQIDSTISISQFIFSDFQKNAFSLDFYPTNKKVKTTFVPLQHQNLSNVLIDTVWFESPGHYLSKQEVLKVKVSNYSDQEVVDLQVNLFVNDSLKAISNESFLPNESKILDMQFVQTKAGWTQAKVELSDYPVTFDNTLYFCYFIDEEIPVLELTNNEVVSFITALFSDDERFAFESTTQAGSFYGKFPNYKIIILNQLNDLSTGLIAALTTAVSDGCQLIVIPPIDMPAVQYNQLLSEIGAPTLQAWRNEKGQMQGLDINHVLFKNAIKSGGDNIRLPDYNGYYPALIPVNSNYDVVLASESGNPIAIKGSTLNSNFLILTIPLNSELTNLPSHPLFVPLLYNSALFSVRFNNLYYTLQPNMEVVSKLKQNGNIELYDSLNNMRQIPKIIPVSGGTRLFLNESDLLAGYNKILQNDEFSSILSFNYNRSESLMAFYSENDLKTYISTSNLGSLRVLKADGIDLVKTIHKQDSHQSLSHVFLWLLVFALVSEVLLIRFMK